MRWDYCDRWNDLLEQPIEPLAEVEARKRHESGELYTAIGEDDDGRPVIVEVRLATGYVGVRFLDDFGRDSLAYSFRESGGRLFLHQIDSYDYGDATRRGGHAEPLVIETVTYTPGGVVRRETDDSRKEMISGTDYDSVDVSAHWESVPTFGDYVSVSRRDRG